MKKLSLTLTVLISLFALLAGSATAQTWHTANQSTVAWDPVTTNSAGDPIASGEVSYTVYLCNAITDPQHQNPVELKNVAETEYVITLNSEGRFYWGVKAVRTVNGEVVGESETVWSSDAPYNFGLQYFLPPANPGGLKQ